MSQLPGTFSVADLTGHTPFYGMVSPNISAVATSPRLAQQFVFNVSDLAQWADGIDYQIGMLGLDNSAWKWNIHVQKQVGSARLWFTVYRNDKGQGFNVAVPLSSLPSDGWLVFYLGLNDVSGGTAGSGSENGRPYSEYAVFGLTNGAQLGYSNPGGNANTSTTAGNAGVVWVGSTGFDEARSPQLQFAAAAIYSDMLTPSAQAAYPSATAAHLVALWDARQVAGAAGAASTWPSAIAGGPALTLTGVTFGGQVVLVAGALALGATDGVSQALTWGAAAGGLPNGSGAAYTYDVQYRVQGASTWQTATSGISGRAYTVTGLAPGTVYEFRVVVHDSTSTPAASNTVSATTSAPTVTGVTVQPTSPVAMLIAATLQLVPTVTGQWGPSQAVTYQSSDATTVSVSGSGLLTAWKAGPVAITVTSVADPTKSAIFGIVVLPYIQTDPAALANNLAPVVAGQLTPLLAAQDARVTAYLDAFAAWTNQVSQNALTPEQLDARIDARLAAATFSTQAARMDAMLAALVPGGGTGNALPVSGAQSWTVTLPNTVPVGTFISARSLNPAVCTVTPSSQPVGPDHTATFVISRQGVGQTVVVAQSPGATSVLARVVTVPA